MPPKKMRVAVIADLHSGATAGLTPPEFDNRKDKFKPMRQRFWKEYCKSIDSLGKIDILIVNGDAIDGPSNTKEAGIGLLHADRNIQVDMAVASIRRVKANQIYMTRGTQFHVGDREDLEDMIADKVGARDIASRIWVDINGVIFDCKHKIGSSSIPHGSFTPLAKTKMWNLYWAEIGLQPKSDIFIRSHTHQFDYCGTSQYLAVSTPSLQGYSRYGSLNVERVIDWGIIWFDVDIDKTFKMDYNIVRIQEAKAKVWKA